MNHSDDNQPRFRAIVNDGDLPPVMYLARAPGQVAEQPVGSGAVVFRGSRSGNPNFDPITGKFAGKKLRNLQVVQQTIASGAPVLNAGVPSGVDPAAWAKRMAFVRGAARSMLDLNTNEMRGYLDGKVVDVNQVDLDSFLADVQWQRMADLADVLDQSVKKGLPVKLVANKQWVKKVFQGLTAAEGVHVVKTLEGLGWKPEDIRTQVIAKIKNVELRNQLDQLYGQARPKSGGKPEGGE